ncbi:MAG: FtsW/RodA/SpoVE family cell cycle protein [Myxococcota bacterium]
MSDRAVVPLATRLPWGILLVSLVISGIGVMNLASAAQATRPDTHWKQLAYFAIGYLLVAFIGRSRIFVLEAVAYPIYLLVNALLVVVLVAGTTVKGAQRWIDLGVIMLQPSELAKISIILVTARYFSRFRVDGGYTLRALLMPLNLSRPLGVFVLLCMRWWKQGVEAIPRLPPNALDAAAAVPEEALADPLWLKLLLFLVVAAWGAGGIFMLFREGLHVRRFIAPADVILLPWALIVIEPDLGTSLIVLAIAGSQVLFAGVRRSSLLIASLALGVTVVFGWSFLLKDYQKRRVETFLNPEQDIQGAGYHSAQSMIAIGSGQLTGKGLGQGTQTQLSFLPENHTDFAFSVLAEEWGFIGGAVLIFLFMSLVLLMLRDARRYSDRFAALVNVGAAAMIFWHVLINIGMVTGLLPVVGMTLPFISYGGSSLLTQMACLGFAVSTRVWRRS